ncbi:MAG: hypothetical protein U1E42_10675 [Rhodospirillales bacterium]
MRALQDQSSHEGVGRYYSIGGSRIGAWSVLPLHAREAANGSGFRPAFHGNAAVDLLEQPRVIDVDHLRFLGEWTPPAVAEPNADRIEPPVVAMATDHEPPVAAPVDPCDFRLASDGELVALGTLTCVLTGVFSVSAFTGLAVALF